MPGGVWTDRQASFNKPSRYVRRMQAVRCFDLFQYLKVLMTAEGRVVGIGIDRVAVFTALGIHCSFFIFTKFYPCARSLCRGDAAISSPRRARLASMMLPYIFATYLRHFRLGCCPGLHSFSFLVLAGHGRSGGFRDVLGEKNRQVFKCGIPVCSLLFLLFIGNLWRRRCR